MNVHRSAHPPLDDDQFDRLVDGELSPHEYQALVASLDDEPGGWRRCALAFLEAQAMRQELGAIGQVVNSGAKVAVATASRPGWKYHLAAAALMLMGIALGAMLPAPWRPAGGDLPAGADLAVKNTPQRPPENQPMQPRPVGSARLVVTGPGGAQSEAGELPIYELKGDLSGWLQSREPAWPAELISELERRGHRVERQQEYVPVDLEDGRQAIIPVEGVKITPVSRRAY
jgi:hypothetical protein